MLHTNCVTLSMQSWRDDEAGIRATSRNLHNCQKDSCKIGRKAAPARMLLASTTPRRMYMLSPKLAILAMHWSASSAQAAIRARSCP